MYRIDQLVTYDYGHRVDEDLAPGLTDRDAAVAEAAALHRDLLSRVAPVSLTTLVLEVTGRRLGQVVHRLDTSSEQVELRDADDGMPKFRSLGNL